MTKSLFIKETPNTSNPHKAGLREELRLPPTPYSPIQKYFECLTGTRRLRTHFKELISCLKQLRAPTDGQTTTWLRLIVERSKSPSVRNFALLALCKEAPREALNFARSLLNPNPPNINDLLREPKEDLALQVLASVGTKKPEEVSNLIEDLSKMCPHLAPRFCAILNRILPGRNLPTTLSEGIRAEISKVIR